MFIRDGRNRPVATRERAIGDRFKICPRLSDVLFYTKLKRRHSRAGGNPVDRLFLIITWKVCLLDSCIRRNDGGRKLAMPDNIDPITLSVVQGALQATQRAMTTTMEKTGRSSVYAIARDYSNALFDWDARMIIQGEDIPTHLGSMVLATKAVARFFARCKSTPVISTCTMTPPMTAATCRTCACTNRCSSRTNWCSGW